MKRVLVEDRFSRVPPFEPGDTWYPSFEGYVVAETAIRYGIKRHWWSPVEWVPKNGSHSRCWDITPNPTTH